MESPHDDGFEDDAESGSDLEELDSGDDIPEEADDEDDDRSPTPTPDRGSVAGPALETGTQLAGMPQVLSAFIPCPFGVFPPIIRFSYDGDDKVIVEKMTKVELQGLRWRYTKTTSTLVKNMLKRIGFKSSSTKHGWIGQWGGHMKCSAFRKLMPHQKVNHLPGSFCIGRKDSLWKNISAMRSQHGKSAFGFLPECFLLPRERHKLKRAWDSAPQNKWILKPNASARGIGIRVVDRWNDVPKTKRVLVQRYVHNPCLINGSKFDLRIYVYVTSFDPLRIYICRDGLTRLATQKYSKKRASTKNRYMHLTNYSVNKNSSDFVSNDDATAQSGHKWSLMALFDHFRAINVDTDKVWESICNVVVRTLLSADGKINSSIKQSTCRRSVCHELFGFDVMLDKNLKAWLIEVNISPSLHSASQLDRDIKGRLMRDVFNLAGFRKPPKQPTQNDKDRAAAAADAVTPPSQPGDGGPTDILDVASGGLTVEERTKHAYYTRHPDECESILDHLTDDDYKIIMETESENTRRGDMQRLFPCKSSRKYLQFTDSFRYYNMLLEQWNKRFGYEDNSMQGIKYLQAVARARRPPSAVRVSASTMGTLQFEASDSMRFDSGGQEFGSVNPPWEPVGLGRRLSSSSQSKKTGPRRNSSGAIKASTAPKRYARAGRTAPAPLTARPAVSDRPQHRQQAVRARSAHTRQLSERDCEQSRGRPPPRPPAYCHAQDIDQTTEPVSYTMGEMEALLRGKNRKRHADLQGSASPGSMSLLEHAAARLSVGGAAVDKQVAQQTYRNIVQETRFWNGQFDDPDVPLSNDDSDVYTMESDSDDSLLITKLSSGRGSGGSMGSLGISTKALKGHDASGSGQQSFWTPEGRDNGVYRAPQSNNRLPRLNAVGNR